MATATVIDLFAADASNELAAALDSVAQATAAGAPRYAPSILRAVSRIVVCRTYGTALFELVHLVAAGTAISDGTYESLFWGQESADAARFRRAFEEAGRAPGGLPSWLGVDGAGICIDSGDGAFRIAYSRMPFLAAVMDFLVASVGYSCVDDLVAALGRRRPSRDELKDAANGVARALYAYLSRHLAPPQSQRKFRRILSFLAARGSAAEAGAIDDDTVLGFWRQASGSGDPDWRTFRAAFLSFVHLRAALLAAATRRALLAARPLGIDRTAGEVDPADVEHAVVGITEHGAALEDLCARAAPVKFLTGRERNSLGLMVEAGDAVAVLPLSLLRAELFGAAQARITQNLRSGITGIEAVGAAFSAAAGEDHDGYEARRTELAGQSAKLDRLLLAAFFVLAKARRAEAITVMLGLRPDIDLRAMAAAVQGPAAGTGARPIGGGIAGVRERFFRVLFGTVDLCPPLDEFHAEARDACKRVARRGFAAADRDRPEVIAAMAAGAEPLFRIRDTVGRYLGALDRALPTAERARARYARDRDIFLAQFRILYGGRP